MLGDRDEIALMSVGDLLIRRRIAYNIIICHLHSISVCRAYKIACLESRYFFENTRIEAFYLRVVVVLVLGRYNAQRKPSSKFMLSG